MMRKYSWAVFILLLSLASTLFAQAPQAPPDVEKRVDAIVNQMTLEEKIDYIGGVNGFYVRAVPRLGLPALKMSDGPVGVRNYGASTALAGGINLAATWDPELVHHAGVVLGEDARARGVHFLLGPGVNIYRAPMNGRNFEYFGEDPYLAAHTVVPYIDGLQSQGVCATVKHFMGNNSEFDRHNVNSIIDERTMREIYLPTFEAAVKQAHVCAIMDSYNLVNGLHMTQNGYLNTDVVKKEWGYPGIIMSDWVATYDAVGAVNGGLDLEMPSGRFMNRENLLPAVKDGRVSEATINDHVRRILRRAIEYGWLNPGYDQTDISISRYNQEGREVALQAAREGMVLLKNDGSLLPLDKTKIKTLAVIGPDAYPAEPVGGGSARVVPFNAVSFLEGLANYDHNIKISYEAGIPTRREMVEQTAIMADAEGSRPGFKAEYFDSDDLTGPHNDRVDRQINYGDQNPIPPMHSVRWTGYYTAKNQANYEVFMQNPGEEGGTRLYIDDKLVLDGWNLFKASVDTMALPLSPGVHKVVMEAYLKERWSNPGLRLAIIDPTTVVSEEAKKLAAQADAVVVPIGFDPYSETEGSDRTFRLPPGQNELVQAMLAANKNVIVVVTSGGGVDMHEWVDQTPALLEAWYPGQEGGTALAQLLFGDYSPSGKLPITFDREWKFNAAYNSYYPSNGSKDVKYTEGVFEGYRHYDKDGIKPLFPFGYGLTYSTFRFSNIKVGGGESSNVSVTFDVTNTGNREAADVAQLYVSDPHASVPRPPKELKGYSKVWLKPGETKTVTLNLDSRSFSYYDVGMKKWNVEPGTFGILVGDSSANVALHAEIRLAP
jgi:beta-glucosidase